MMAIGWLIAGVAVVTGSIGFFVWSRRLLESTDALGDASKRPGRLWELRHPLHIPRDWLIDTPEWIVGKPKAEHALRRIKQSLWLAMIGVVAMFALSAVGS